MFDFLKKKLKDFVGGIVGKVEVAAPEPQEQAKDGAQAPPKTGEALPEKPAEEKPVARPPETGFGRPVEKKRTPTKEAPAEKIQEEKKPAVPGRAGEQKTSEAARAPLPVEKAIVLEEAEENLRRKERDEARVQSAVSTLEKAPVIPLPSSPEDAEEEQEIEELVGGTEEGRIKREQKLLEKRLVEEKKKEDVARTVFREKPKEAFLVDERERALKPRVGFFSQLKGMVTGSVVISEPEVEPLLKELEVALLEGDVSLDTAQALVKDLKSRIVGKRVARGQLETEVKKEIAFALASVMQVPHVDLAERVRHGKKEGQAPYVILFLGPNGAGKTTTIAKVAKALQKEGLSSVISASDTFRAAAIEQAEFHGRKLGIEVVRHKYGADPAAVAFDAISHAKAKKLDAVLIDTAGRQETNRNLLAEMEKIVRVTKPHLKVFVAEAIAGTALVGQLKTFHEKLRVDGIILTKLDCDAKGGGSLSIVHECRLPVLYVGVGQGYDDLKPFNETWIVRNLLAE